MTNSAKLPTGAGIIIAPLQLLEEEGGHAFQRSLDAASAQLDNAAQARTSA